jgi:hypothetical protein
LFVACGLSPDFSGGVLAGSDEELSLSDFFQQASELQRQNEASILNAEMQVKCGTFSSTLPLVIEHTYWACW